MTKKRKVILLISLCLAGGVILAACKVSGRNTSEATVGSIITAESSVPETIKETTETAVVTNPTQKPKITPMPTVKETTAAAMEAFETAAPAATTKATAAPAATTKAPVATAAAAPPVATTAAAPSIETTAAPATDYSAVCAEIRSKLIAILEANGQWDEAFTGEITNGGSQWWGVGFYDDREMSTADFAQHFYANKFAGRAICGTSITCYMADGNINIAYKAYWTS